MFKVLLLVNAFLTFAAFLLFFLAPQVLPSGVGAQIDPSAYFLGYMAGSAELGIAIISFYARKIVDVKLLSAICIANSAFHAFSVVAEILLITSGRSTEPWSLWGNMALRITLAALFAYYGYRFSIRKSIQGMKIFEGL